MRCIFLISFISISFLIHAQQELGKIPVNFAPGAATDPNMAVITSKLKDSSCLFLTTKRDNAAYILDKNHKLIKQFLFTKQKNSDVVIGGFFNNGNMIFVTGSDMEDYSITVYNYNFKDNKLTSGLLSVKAKQEKLFGFINAADCIYMLSAEKNSSVMHLITIKGVNNLVKETLPVSPSSALNDYIKPDFFNAISDVSTFSRLMKIGYVETGKSAALNILNYNNKIYYYNDSLYITLNKLPAGTLLIAINPLTKGISYREIKGFYNDCSEN